MNLKRKRTRYGISQAALANYLGVSSQVVISNWERNIYKPSPGHRKKLRKLFKSLKEGQELPKQLQPKQRQAQSLIYNRDQRIKHNLTQDQIAEYLQLRSIQVISRWEAGTSQPSKLNSGKLAKLFDWLDKGIPYPTIIRLGDQVANFFTAAHE